MATLIYWSKLESDSDVTSPHVGPAGTVDGSPTYVACKFNNGIYCDAVNEGFHVPNTGSFLSGNKGTFECWSKTDFNVVDGIASDSIEHYGAILNPAGNALMYIIEFSLTLGFGIGRRDDAANWVNCHDNTTDWTAGDLVHIAVVWDKDAGFDGAKTMAIYVNGVESASITTALGTFTDDTTDVYVTNNSSLNRPLEGILDNLKIWDYGKIDFSDKDTENAGYALNISVHDCTDLKEKVGG